MSNLIKAYTIRYEEKKKEIDLNARAEELKDMFLEKEKERIRNLSSYSDESSEYGEYGEYADYGDEEGGFAPLTPPVVTEIDEEQAAEQEMIATAIEENRLLLEQQEQRIVELEQQADIILQTAKNEADEILRRAEKEASDAKIRVLEEANEEGYRAGAEAARIELENGRNELYMTEQRLRASYEKQVDELEPAFVEMLIKYVRSITGILVNDRREIITYVIDSFIKKQERAKDYIVRVSSEDYETVKNAADILEHSVPEDASLEIIEDRMLKRTQCMIECDSRLFDVSLEHNLNGLIEDLKLLTM